ncbi:sulfatase [Candidatus Poribacteria bacterium]|nr:sulfatase [Candidatus Poribacteria bacterium]
MTRPNILYIHSHDTGRYIQPYGYAVPTPNIQRLAEQGILFRQSFCAGPTCSPSRASLLTGQSAHSSGMIGLAHRGFSLKDYNQHIIHTLRKVGYHSALSGVQHIARDAKIIGYDQILTTQGDKAAVKAVDFLSNAPPQPFFLSVGFGATHRKFPEPGPAEDARYCLPPAPLPDTPETRRDMAAFKASASILDMSIGIILETLDKNGLAENTLVICTTDHGIAFPGMKCNLTDHGIGVMLIMRGPGGFTGGMVCDAMVSHIDLFPTICDLLEIEHPEWLQGNSMMPLIRGGVDEINDEIFAEVTYHAAYEPQRAVRTQRWKYIRRFEERHIPVLPNCDDSLSKDVWLKYGWRERPVPQEQLYDLIFDPNETHNLAGEPSMVEVLAEMRGRLERWMRATADPLLNGPVPAPSGARFNDPDGLSPQEETLVAP